SQHRTHDPRRRIRLRSRSRGPNSRRSNPIHLSVWPSSVLTRISCPPSYSPPAHLKAIQQTCRVLPVLTKNRPRLAPDTNRSQRHSLFPSKVSQPPVGSSG